MVTTVNTDSDKVDKTKDAIRCCQIVRLIQTLLRIFQFYLSNFYSATWVKTTGVACLFADFYTVLMYTEREYLLNFKAANRFYLFFSYISAKV